MGKKLLGVGEYATTDRAGEVLATMALGACVAVIALDSSSGMVGMAHVVLPDSTISPKQASLAPGYFADTGVASLIEEFSRASRESGQPALVIKLVGASSLMDPENIFDVGQRNLAAVQRALTSRNLCTSAEDVGGHISRSVRVHAGTCRVLVSSTFSDEWEI